MDGGVRGQYEKFAKMPLISALGPESECALSMSEPAFSLPCLRDVRLAPVATSALPAWLWSADANRILWANPTGAAIFGAATSAAVSTRKFDAGQPAAAQIAQLAATLPPDGSPRLERLRGFGAGVGRALACACSRITLADDTPAVLVVAAERAGPELVLNERVRRLLAGCDQPVAVFAPEGKLIHATPAAAARLDGATSLAALGAPTLAADAVRTGHAEAEVAQGPIAADRIGSDGATVLIATFPQRRPADEPAPGVIAPITSEAKSDAALAPEIVAPSADPAAVVHESMPSSDAAPAPPPGAAKGAPEAPANEPVAGPVTGDTVLAEESASPAIDDSSSLAETAAASGEAQASPDVAAQPPPQPPADAPELPSSPAQALPMPPERRHPLRFVWQMDEAGRFTLGSDEFIALIGPRTAAVLGRPWQDIAAELALDPERRVAQALATHETWSGLTVGWPVDDSTERLAVELSGLPVFDRARDFRGYRGFGVCRDLARIAELAHRRSAAASPSGSVAEAGEAPPAPSDDMPPLLALIAPAENVVPFPSVAADGSAPALNAIERRAFRELSRRLTQHLNHADPDLHGPAVTADGDDAGAAAHVAAVPPVDPELFEPLEPAVTGVHALSSAPQTGYGAGSDNESEPEAAGATTDARPFLDRLPFGVLVYRLSHLLYANHPFLRWSGYESVGALAEAGGLDSLFVEPGAVSFETGGDKPFAISSSIGEKTKAEGRLFLVPWAGESAFALLTIPVAQDFAARDFDARDAEARDREAQERAAQDRAAEQRQQAASSALAVAQAEGAELNSILDTATDGVVLIDRAGVILSSNRSAEALFGYESRELVGRSLFDLFAPESLDTASEYLDGLRQDGARLLNGGREVIGRVRQGGLIPLFMTMGRIGDGADKLCAVFRDITPWKKVEEELTEAKRQAEKASSAKSDFLAKISHEIRTPLNAIIGFSEVMMEERFGPIANDRYRAYLKDIHTSGGHLISLINDLLDLSKIEAGKLELTFAGVALNDLTQQCVALMQPQANRDRIIIRTSLSPKLPEIVADARSVRQIALNLLSNSIKFTGAGGQVIVSTALTDNGEVVLRVRDTGIGMSEKDIETALEPFRQLATSGRGGSGGTGLGLPLTKALAEANRAKFHIKSAPNAGTLVEIAFPAMRVSAG